LELDPRGWRADGVEFEVSQVNENPSCRSCSPDSQSILLGINHEQVARPAAEDVLPFEHPSIVVR
jgi:hypothetical protein